MSESLLNYPAPRFSIDETLMPQLTRDLLHLQIEESNAGMRTLNVRFLAFGPGEETPRENLLYLDGALFDFGSRVSVDIGPEDNRRTLFNGLVSAIEADFEEGHEPEVTLYAEDELMKLRLSRRMASYENMSDADIAGEIAEKNGLAAQADADGPVYDAVQQWNMSDLAFLRDRAKRIQADIWFEDGTLYFQSRSRRNGSELTLVQGNHLLQLSACGDLSRQRSAVHVCGYDAAQREVIDETAGADVIRAEATGGRSGPEILAEAFAGDRISYRLRDVPLNSEEARAWADNEMLRRARSFVTVRGVTRGTPDMNVGSRLTLERVGRPFEGDGYYVTGVRHSYDLARGYRTSFVAERATIGGGR